MTNEEILEKLLHKKVFDHLHTGLMKLTDKEILSAMDAAREDEAVGFAEWKDRNGYILSHSSPKDRLIYIHESDKRTEASRVKYYYTTELYQLYLKSKQKQHIVDIMNDDARDGLYDDKNEKL